MSQELLKIFRAPEFIREYLHFFLTAEEMRLLPLLGAKALTAEEVAALWGQPADRVSGLLETAYRRQVLNREISEGLPRYKVGEFYDRLDSYSKFGNYYILPCKIRRQLEQWDFQEYLQKNDYFQLAVTGAPGYQQRYSEVVLLLQEAEEMVAAASVIRVVPCNCKMLSDNCSHSREICLTLDQKRVDERTGGRELTENEAIHLIRQLDKEGLVHTGAYNWREVGPSFLCNCCSCCCFPFRAGMQLGTRGRWPKSHYLACYHKEKCRSCGLCARRCPFGAFRLDQTQKLLTFNQELCWGCGLCANQCPGQAIEMKQI